MTDASEKQNVHKNNQGDTDSPKDDPCLSLPTIGEQLGLGPKLFRSLLDTYSDLLSVYEKDNEKVMPEEDFQILKQIHQLTLQGLTEAEIRDKLEQGHSSEVAATVDSDASITESADDAEEELVRLIESLQQRLKQSEERRVEDRDQLMMMLMRTQRELRSLRYELTKDQGRRRKSFWERFFGG